MMSVAEYRLNGEDQSMAKVPLRVYIKEIETIIEQKQTEEAIAHCRHILQFYPKHIDTYRMLGKAYLESQRYGNAADIFQRVLSSVPDDFVSHVGMSIIREDESNLDAAIWHMERAFEGQPYNAAIQSELRRLYGRRDGMEPPKVYLTRGALARMYVKGNLHQQAVAELRAAIAEDPQRFDLRVYLAQMYAQSGDQVKAIETCGSIVSKLPYCIEANRLLAQLLEKTERIEEAQGYKKRVEELNPYEAFVGPNAPNESQVPAQAVIVDQLIWDGGPAVAASDQPEWAATAGVDFGEATQQDEGLPDWMSGSASEYPALLGSSEAPSDSEAEQIPDWMKEAGWGPSTGTFDESKSAFADEEEALPAGDAEAVAGNIPDWLQQMAPPGAIENPDEVSEDELGFSEATASGEEIPDWLQGLDQEKESIPEDLPDWLTPAAGITAAAAISGLSDKDQQTEDVDLPDWLAEEDLELEAADETEGESLPEWLQEISTDESIELDAEESAIPDWLVEDNGELTTTDETAESELPDWLQEAAEQEIEEAIPEAEVSELPDWLAPAGGITAAAAIAGLSDKEQEPEEAELSDWLVEETIAETEENAEEESLPDWLQDMSTEESTAEAEEAELPDWLVEETTEAETIAEEESLPEWLQEMSTEEATDESEDVELPEWLAEETIAETEETLEAVVEEEEIAETEVGTEEETLPEWLQEAAELETGEATAEAEEAELPDWLVPAAGLAAGAVAAITSQEQESTESTMETAEEAVPDWLADEPEVETEETIAEAEEIADAEESMEEAVPEWLQEDSDAELLTEEQVIPDWLAEEPGTDIEETLETLIEEEEIVETEADAEDESLPEWLQEAAELETGEATAEAEEAELPDWLVPAAGLAAGAVAATAGQEQESAEGITEPDAEAEGKTVPAWLAEELEVETEEMIAEAEESMEEAVPEWLQEDSEAEPTTEEQVIPDWPQEEPETEIEETVIEAEETVETLAEVEEIPEAEPIEEEAVPEWLQEEPKVETEEAIAEVEESFEAVVEVEELSEAEPIEEETAPEWLQEVDEEESDEPILADAELPDWLASAAGMAAGAAIVTALSDDDQDSEDRPDESSIEATEVSEWFQESVEETPEETAAKIDEIDSELPDWLQDIPQDAPVSYSELNGQAQEEEIPAWLHDISDEIPTIAGETEIVSDSPAEPEIDDIPDWMQDIADEETPLHEEVLAAPIDQSIEQETTEPDLDDVDAAMAWLESLAAKQGVSEEELLTSPEERSETPPDWIQASISDDTEAAVEFAEDEISSEKPAAWIAEDQDQQIQTEIPETTSELPVEEPESTWDDRVEPDISDLYEIAPIADDEIEEIEESEFAVATVDEQDIVATPDFELGDVDAAMAWLEGLAAKQGVSEEELLTSPEERSETPPEWVTESLEEEEAHPHQAEPETDIPEWILEAPKTQDAPETLEQIPEISETTEAVDLSDQGEPSEIEPDLSDSDAAMAWLESLAAKQGVSEDELLTSPEERSETPPAWVQAAANEQTQAKAESIPTEELREWISEVPDIGEPVDAPIPGYEPEADTETETGGEIDFEDADAALAWLEGLAAKQGVSEDELLTRPEDRKEAPPTWVQIALESAEESGSDLPETLEEPEALEIVASEEELQEFTTSSDGTEEPALAPPAWIADGEIPEDDDYSWLPADVSEAITAEAQELLDLNEASLIQLERLPGVGFRRAQAITAYRQEHGDFANLDELYSVPGLDTETIDFLKTRVMVKQPEVASKPEIEPEVLLFETQEGEPEDEVHEQQLAAQNKLSQGDFSGAISEYNAIIQSGQRLNQVIEDLNKATELYPAETVLFQTLGDACMQANRLQEALEAYNKAEELLQ